MKLVYILNQRFPTEKAYGIQVAQMCSAFSKQGLDIELLVPTRISKEMADPFTYYNLDKNFKFTLVSSLDIYLPGVLNRLAFWIKNLVSAFKLSKIARSRRADVIYAREELPLLFLAFGRRKKLVLELHRFSKNRTFLYHILANRGVMFVTVTEGLRKDLIASGITALRVYTAHDGVDIEKFELNIGKDEARRQLNLPLDKKIVLYAGHLYERKGIEVLAKSISHLSDDILVIFVGGTDRELKSFKKRWGNESKIMIAGRKPHEQIPVWLHAADVLVLPNLPDELGQERYTSPLKLFEYIASGRPIVTSDLPALREVLSDDEATFVYPGNSHSLAEGIKFILSTSGQAEIQIHKLRESVKKYSWQKRAENILLFLKP